MSQSPSSVWNNCLSFIEDNIQPQAYNTWFKPIIPIKVTDNVLSIQVPSKFFYEWLEEHYIKILKLALVKELGKDARLVYIIKMENTFGNKAPFTEKIPSSNNSSIKSQTENNQNELISVWVYSDYENEVIEYVKSKNFNKNESGIEFKKNGKLIKRQNIGWCGTPPITYDNYDGSWEFSSDSTLTIIYDYWGGAS